MFEHEPAVNPRLLRAKKAVLLPHMGSATFDGRIDMGRKLSSTSRLRSVGITRRTGGRPSML